jgi:hypothetical protein
MIFFASCDLPNKINELNSHLDAVNNSLDSLSCQIQQIDSMINLKIHTNQK